MASIDMVTLFRHLNTQEFHIATTEMSTAPSIPLAPTPSTIEGQHRQFLVNFPGEIRNRIYQYSTETGLVTFHRGSCCPDFTSKDHATTWAKPQFFGLTSSRSLQNSSPHSSKTRSSVTVYILFDTGNMTSFDLAPVLRFAILYPSVEIHFGTSDSGSGITENELNSLIAFVRDRGSGSSAWRRSILNNTVTFAFYPWYTNPLHAMDSAWDFGWDVGGEEDLFEEVEDNDIFGVMDAIPRPRLIIGVKSAGDFANVDEERQRLTPIVSEMVVRLKVAKRDSVEEVVGHSPGDTGGAEH
ncbi:hypothetical protein P154DRAFT_568851 [Amniculicola lignicola CBS 123094]|uniref:Uncharacterized protein n=1 Tax=Amniculicola lignicola CBS 123094 TaxID=1392246 RepID=A0A6A5X522_9PLEO|nr:hypothetical protein P154DRAFT_568851 [Amniculicola lignicola CBS 123094]